MIIRIVKMSFKSDQINNFILLFDSVKMKIRSYEGCQHLDLLQDKNDPSILFTYSHWSNENALNNYRSSNLFIQTWAKTKKLFSNRPEAWSTQVVSTFESNLNDTDY